MRACQLDQRRRGARQLAANVAVAESKATGRVIAAWPAFPRIASYEQLIRRTRPRGGSGRQAGPAVATGAMGRSGGQRPDAGRVSPQSAPRPESTSAGLAVGAG
jgi:hypothetical protein